jgi:hypothetical protein
MRSTASVIVTCAALALSGCDLNQMVDAKVEAKAREYFPLAEVSHPQHDILLIKTHVGNISEKFAAQVMATLIQKTAKIWRWVSASQESGC